MDDTKRDLEIDRERAIGAAQAMARQALAIMEATDATHEDLRHADDLMASAAKQTSIARMKRYRLDAMLREEAEATPSP